MRIKSKQAKHRSTAAPQRRQHQKVSAKLLKACPTRQLQNLKRCGAQKSGAPEVDERETASDGAESGAEKLISGETLPHLFSPAELQRGTLPRTRHTSSIAWMCGCMGSNQNKHGLVGKIPEATRRSCLLSDSFAEHASMQALQPSR